MTQIRHKAVVVGGGLVGGLTALLLQKAGIQPMVLDAAPPLDASTVVSQLDTRVLALNTATIHLLKTVNVWEGIQRYAPYTGMHVWNKNGYGEISFGEPSVDPNTPKDWLGAMIEPSIVNLAIQQRMFEILEHYRTNIVVKHVEADAQGWCITLNHGEKIYTHLLIGADGANSLVRHQAGIEIKLLDYQQAAIGCAIKTQQRHCSVARQIFLPTGPLAYLPLADKSSVLEQGYWQSIVWTLPKALCEQYMQLSDEDFKQQLTQSSLYLQGGVVDVSKRANFHLKARAAKHYVQSGLALVGDAAHVIHPLAGQGVNIGCLDAAILVDALMSDLENTGHWANFKTLKKYEKSRKIENEMTMHGMSLMNWLQRSNTHSIVWARTFGLRQVHRFKPLKSLFIQQASGISALSKSRYRL
ncbi:FAD-dependent monooxygenase [Acinetobacter sp. B5B]|uniref:FAD-dependent monooxygenase n=1 Tax=Acinetobacter baretiae TaxID=2605383 RepID=UPI0018C2E5F4|nr:FAD-dependent monooxygenase [Acinetobacter baretiae]MBF7683568.1 FAD-dependent monooxygenase [Acinetobacter baretiae]